MHGILPTITKPRSRAKSEYRNPSTRAAARALGRYATELNRVDLDELALMVDGLERVARGEGQPYRLCIALDARQLREARQQLGL